MDDRVSPDPAQWVARLTHQNDQMVGQLADYLRTRHGEAPERWGPALWLIRNLYDHGDTHGVPVGALLSDLQALPDNTIIPLAAACHAVVVTTFMPANGLWEMVRRWQAPRVVEVLTRIDHSEPDDEGGVDEVLASIGACSYADMACLACLCAAGLHAVDFPASELSAILAGPATPAPTN
jgi:hypothetical protein